MPLEVIDYGLAKPIVKQHLIYLSSFTVYISDTSTHCPGHPSVLGRSVVLRLNGVDPYSTTDMV